ncbi:hypothetical protein FOA52_007294 [Chlamydomonas sp. UWO 241]|nr:hypothetical protein FOA52_007294 [Chlamydomonas sp. UWO 241]
MLAWGAVGAVGLVASLLMSFMSDTSHFIPGACDRVDSFVSARVVGQQLAVNQLVDAVCTHLADAHPQRPLVISVHGPPGVGKTYTHTLLARALYSSDPLRASKCPGEDCQGAKVVYGMNFMLESQGEQLAAVRSAILEHARSTPDALIVIEEYDKLDCPSRGMLRQLLASPDAANASALNRAIVLLESNLGFSELEEMLLAVEDRETISAETAEKALRDVVFAAWVRAECESYPDTLKLVSMVDFFLPYFPLQRPQVEQLVGQSLSQWGDVLWHEKHARLAWGQDVVSFLTDRVDFDGPFPLEGGKQVPHVATRYVARLVRKAPLAAPPPKQVPAPAKATSSGGSSSGVIGGELGPWACDAGGGVGGESGDAEMEAGLVCGRGSPGSPMLRLVVAGGTLALEPWPALL